MTFCAGILLFSAVTGFTAETNKEFYRIFECEPGVTFILENYRGSVSVQSTDKPDIEVRALITVRHPDEEAVQELLEATEVVIKESSASSVHLKVNTDKELIRELSYSEGFWNLFKKSLGSPLKIDFEVSVPKKSSLEIMNNRGPVSIADINGDLDIKNSRGSIEIKQIHGNVRARTERASLVLADIVGPVIAVNHRGSILIERVEGSLEAKTERAGMEISAVTGPVIAGNHRGGITIDDVTGTVRASTERSSIEIFNVSDEIQAVNHRGSIHVEYAASHVSAVTERSHIELFEVKGDIEAKNDRGKIHITRAEGSVRAETDRGSIHAEIIELSPNPRFFFKSDRGDIEVLLPENLNADVNIQVLKGEVESDFPLSISGTISDRKMEGSINGGGIPLEIYNSEGSVRMKKL